MTAKSAVNFGGALVAGVFLSTSQQSVVNKKARTFGLFLRLIVTQRLKNHLNYRFLPHRTEYKHVS